MTAAKCARWPAYSCARSTIVHLPADSLSAQGPRRPRWPRCYSFEDPMMGRGDARPNAGHADVEAPRLRSFREWGSSGKESVWMTAQLPRRTGMGIPKVRLR